MTLRGPFQPLLFCDSVKNYPIDLTKGTLSKTANDTNFGGVVNSLDGCAAVQRDLNRLGKWVRKNLINFKYQFSSLQRNNTMHQDRLKVSQLESSFEESLLSRTS